MNVSTVADGVFQLKVNVENILFEGLWEIPEGVSLNSYIVKGEKSAIIDGVCGWDGYPESFYKFFKELEIDPMSVEYVIVNHVEPDHSGWIEDFKNINPNFKIVCSKKAEPLIQSFYEHSNEVIIVGDGDSLDLGNGKILDFAEIPNVHWPETIATFDRSTGTLFPCDAFGSFGRVEESPYDDMLNNKQIEYYEKEAVRYYANIVAAFSLPVVNAIKKCSDFPIKIIAPGHGIVWRKNPEKIINDYIRYASYQKGPAKKEITIIWGSMYGMTERSVNYIKEVLKDEDIKVNIHRVPEDSTGAILNSIWTSTGVILAMPTYEYKMFPPLAAVLDELGRKKVQNRLAFRTGSFGWSGGAQKELDEILARNRMNWNFIEPVEFKGNATKEDLDLIKERVLDLVNKVKELVKE